MFKMSNLLFGILLFGFCILVLYALCKWCNENSSESQSNKKENERLMMKPVYAHEIEPGIVILQNEEGDYFKILKEYDSKSDNLYGSVACTRPEMMQTPTRMSTVEPEMLRHNTGTNGIISPSAPPVIPAPQGNKCNVHTAKRPAYKHYDNPPPYARN
jgi:hypothetical protein